MKKIICTTDYSENSISALKYTYAISKLLNLPVIVLHVFNEIPRTEIDSIPDEKRIALHHKNRIRDFCSLYLKQKFESLDFSVAAVKGIDVSREILHFVRDIHVCMLVMGVCESENLKEFFLGSTTTKMLTVSPFPVLVVPNGFVFKKLKKVLYCSDLLLKDIYNIGGLAKIISPVNSKIIVAHIAEKDDLMNKNLLDWFKKSLSEKVTYQNIEIETIFSDKIFESLQFFIEQTEADMVVMMKRKHKPEINYVLHRDLVKRVQSGIKVPLLSFNETS